MSNYFSPEVVQWFLVSRYAFTTDLFAIYVASTKKVSSILSEVHSHLPSGLKRPFPMRFDFELQILIPSHFQMWTWQIETVSLCEKYIYIVRAEIRANAETNCCCGLAPRRDALMRCTARSIQASEPTLTASGLAAKRRAECTINTVNLLVFCIATDCFCCCCSLRVRIHGGVHAECASLGIYLRLSPRQPTVVWPRKTRRPPTARREQSNVAIQLCHHPTHRSFCCWLLS